MRIKLKYILVFLLIISPLLLNANDNKIYLGVIQSLSSFGAKAGNAELNAILLAKDEINKSGGVNGKQIELIVQDNNTSISKTVTAFNYIASNKKVVGIIGPNWSEFAEVIIPIANNRKVPVITASSYNETFRKKNSYVFSLWPDHAIAVKPIIEDLKKQNYKNIKLISTENAYYLGQAKEIQKALGIKKIDTFNISETSYQSYIIKNKDADVMITMLLETGEIESFVKQKKELNAKFDLYLSNQIPYSKILSDNLNLVEGAKYIDYIIPDNSNFNQKYLDRFKIPAENASAKAYDAVYIFKNAIENCKEEIVKCISKISYSGVSGLIEFDKYGIINSIKRNTELYKVEDQKIIKLK